MLQEKFDNEVKENKIQLLNLKNDREKLLNKSDKQETEIVELKNEELSENIQTSIFKLKEKLRLLKNNKIDYDFKHVDEIKKIDKTIIEVEAANDVLKKSLKEHEVTNQRKEKKSQEIR